MRYKELPLPTYDESGKPISYIFDTSTNEYIALNEYRKKQELFKELIRSYEERTVACIGARIVSRQTVIN